MTHTISLTVNGRQSALQRGGTALAAGALLARCARPDGHQHRLRYQPCGSCTVHLDGEAVKACTVLAVQADGATIKTIEGMDSPTSLHPLQEAFREEHGPAVRLLHAGMIMAADALLRHNHKPSEAQIRQGLEGNMCRCTVTRTL
ncbi:glyceraldehyde dehydrogenase small chain [Anaerolineaceae bacterium]|nr:glyceraldehyde dehydrogenase small chain [Anaerolineaceae bacterium]